MMNHISANVTKRWAEVGANVAIITVSIVFLALIAINHFHGFSNFQPPGAIGVGMKLALNDVDWHSGGRLHLVLALSTGCHFCAESVPFYQELVKECREAHIPVVAVFPQPLDEATAYLHAKGIDVDAVRQQPLQRLRVRGTPTLLLVNEQGLVVGMWFGKLPEEREQEVLSRIKS